MPGCVADHTRTLIMQSVLKLKDSATRVMALRFYSSNHLLLQCFIEHHILKFSSYGKRKIFLKI